MLSQVFQINAYVFRLNSACLESKLLNSFIMYSHEHLDPYALATHSSAFMSLVSFFFIYIKSQRYGRRELVEFGRIQFMKKRIRARLYGKLLTYLITNSKRIIMKKNILIIDEVRTLDRIGLCCNLFLFFFNLYLVGGD